MRLAAIGFGHRLSHMYGYTVRGQCPEARMVAILDPDPEAARARLPEDEREQVLIATDLDDLIRRGKPDGIMIGTRCNLHAQFAQAVARYRLPLFLEKPVATTLADAVALEQAWGDRHEQVLVSFPLRVSPLIDQARTLLAEAQTGRMSHVNAVNYVTYGWHYFDKWYRDFATTQGLFLQKATHDFDYLAHLMQSPIVRVAAMTLRGRVHQDVSLRQGDGEMDVTYHENIGTPETGMNEDCSSALIEFANGVHGTYSQVFFTGGTMGSRGATLCGQRCTVTCDWRTELVRRIWHDRPHEEQILVKPVGGHGGGDSVLGRNFIELVRGTQPSLAPLQVGLESAYACLAAKESAETGRFVTVRRWGAV